jgi:replicative DNA helicase
LLHRPEAYDPEHDPGEAQFIIAKHRGGPTGMVKLTWIRECTRFENYINPHIANQGTFFDKNATGSGNYQIPDERRF